MRAAVAIVLLLAAGTFAVWWWSRTSVAPPTHAANGAPSAQPAEPSPAVGAVEPAVRQPGELPASLAAPAIPDDAIWVEVRVVDRGTQQPLAGADVWWKDRTIEVPAPARPQWWRLPWFDGELWCAQQFGWRARTDARGVARVHAHVRGTQVFAQLGDRFGATDVVVEDARRGITLLCDRELAVAVQVVDARGRPAADVPVELSLDPPARSTTDRDGLVRFEHLQHHAEIDAQGAYIAQQVTARVDRPGLRDCAVVFALLEPPTEPLVITLPATGELHARVLHPGRELEEAVGDLWIGAPDDQDARNDGYQCERDASGSLCFRWLPLGQVFELRVTVSDLELQQTVRGPTSPDQVVHTTFEVPATAVALTGRILLPDGEPAASREIDVDYSLSNVTGGILLATDDRGRFSWHVHQSSGDGEATELLEFLVAVAQSPIELLHATVAPCTLRPGVNDLGDIRVAPRPLVVSGRFVFDRPATHDRVSFAIERWIDESPGHWQVESELSEKQDDDGRFVVRGAPWPGRLRLDLGDLAPPVEFERGAENLVVPLVQGHLLEVHCKVPEGLVPESLIALVRSAAGAEPRQQPLEFADRGLEAAQFPHLAAGQHSIEVRMRGLDDVLASTSITFPGPDGELDRVVALELDAAVLRVHVRLPEGAPPDEGRTIVFVDQLPDGRMHDGHIVPDGKGALLVPKRPVDLTIARRGWQPVVLRSVRGSVDVLLEHRVPTAKLTVVGAPTLPPPQALVVDVAGVDRDDWRVRLSTHDYERTQELVGCPHELCEVPVAGTLEIRAADVARALTVSLHDGDRAIPLRRATPAVIPAGTGPVTIRVDADEVRAAVEQAKKGH